MQGSKPKQDNIDSPVVSFENEQLNLPTEELYSKKSQIDVQTLDDDYNLLDNQQRQQITTNEFQTQHYNNPSQINNIMNLNVIPANNFANPNNTQNINNNIRHLNRKQDDYVDSLFGNESLSLFFNSEFDAPNKFFFQPSNLRNQIDPFSNQLQVPSNPFGNGENSNDMAKSENHSENGGDNNSRNVSRGLRKLSLKVKEIVQNKKQTTYKEVAQILVDQMKIQAKLDNVHPDELQKDEQNIKRRVYDALNVLIAAQVINKKGKIVSSIENTKLSGKCLNTQNWKEMKQKQKELDQKKREILDKQKTVIQLFKQNIALKNLQQGNRQQEEIENQRQQKELLQSQESINKFFKSQDGNRIQSIQNNQNNNILQNFSQNIENDFLQSQQYMNFTQSPFQSQLSQNNNLFSSKLKNSKLKNKDNLKNIDVQQDIKFQFPMLLAIQDKFNDQEQENEQDHEKIIMKMSKDQKQFKMYSKQPLNIYGDLDILIKLGYHKVSQDFLFQNVKDPQLVKFYNQQNINVQQKQQNNQTNQQIQNPLYQELQQQQGEEIFEKQEDFSEQ